MQIGFLCEFTWLLLRQLKKINSDPTRWRLLLAGCSSQQLPPSAEQWGSHTRCWPGSPTTPDPEPWPPLGLTVHVEVDEIMAQAGQSSPGSLQPRSLGRSLPAFPPAAPSRPYHHSPAPLQRPSLLPPSGYNEHRPF